MQIQLDNLGRIYTWDWAVRGLSATLAAGEVTCILGANGSGKSTLLKLIADAIEPTEGRVLYDGKPLRATSHSTRRRFMLLEPEMPIIAQSALRHIGAMLSIYKQDADDIHQRGVDWLKRFGLPPSMFRGQPNFSRGQRMKLWLAAMLTIRPDIWLMDEPHQSGLDAAGMEILENEIRRHCESGGSVVFTTQYPPHATELADRVMVLNSGSQAFFGTVSELAREPSESESDPFAAIVRSLQKQSSASEINNREASL